MSFYRRSLSMLDLEAANALLALGLVLIPLGLCWSQGLKLSGMLLLSVGRALLQLIVLAYGLAIAFSAASPWVTLIVLGLFVAITTQLLSRRMVVDLPGLGPWILAALLSGVGVVLSYGVWVVIQLDPWFAPQFWIPLGSALLAHGLSGGRSPASNSCVRSSATGKQSKPI
ncbi:MAG: ABC transporter permease [Synechococcales cyanobacterium RU_4_20]|nr:ABC transporter permease [Synechococcales cyanobacterium RU_4_20]NJR69041.1 ABC transporter permease [Synechococcales cyanobacterium CRU_2_2]